MCSKSRGCKDVNCTAGLSLIRVTALVCILVLLNPIAALPQGKAAAAAKTSTIHIRTVEDFEALAEKCKLDTWSQGKRVVLEDDISLEGAEVQAIPTFGGIFDGNGHTISGLSLTENASPTGLFGILQTCGEIQDLHVSGTVAPDGDCSSTGGIAGENYGKIDSCTFTGSVAGKSMTGGIVGMNALTGRITDCSVSGSVTGRKMTGGIAGCSQGRIRDCRNSAYVNTESVDPSVDLEKINLEFSLDVKKLPAMETAVTTMDTGGIAGYSSGRVTGCTNLAAMGYPHIGYNIGGITGRSCGYIYSCENKAAISGRKDVGGVVGQMEPFIAQEVKESTLNRLEKELSTLDGLLSKALNDGNGAIGNVSSRLSRIADYMDSAAGAASDIRTSGSLTGKVEGSSSAASSKTGGSADSRADASAQMIVTTSLGGLSSAISGMSGQMRLLSNEIAGASGTMTNDLKAIQKQINSISDIALELFEGSDENVVTDSSEKNISSVKLGKISSCTNSGTAQGDVNTGGIAGAMAMEYTLDPEDDVSSGLSGKQRSAMELKAIITDCINTGEVSSRYNYAGGICGRMDLGLINRGEGYGRISSEYGDYVGGIAGVTASVVRDSFAKCFLSGGEYVGGIAGCGVDEEAGGDCSKISGCYSMVEIEESTAFNGAISGADAGTFRSNYFVSDTLTGINGRSYTNRAEPISYESLLKKAEKLSLPDAFREFTAVFEADGETVQMLTFSYGDTLETSSWPKVPKKEGYYGRWNKTSLQNLHFDTVIKAVYSPYVSTLSDTGTRSDGRPIFFVEGMFDEGEEVKVTAMPNTPYEFDNLADGWSGLLTKGLSETEVGREIVEQWKISIPDDGEDVHTVRYLAPNADPSHLAVYLKEKDGWKKTDAKVIGSYLSFSVTGQDAEIAVIDTVDTGIIWSIIILLLLMVAAAEIFLICRKIGKKRKKDGTQSSISKEINGEHTASRRRKRRRKPFAAILLTLILIAAAAAACFLTNIVGTLQICDILKEYAEKEELSMELTVDAMLGSETADFTAEIDRTIVDGHPITAVSQDGWVLYYNEGTVYLENGNAYRITDEFPDYLNLLYHAQEIYGRVDIQQEDQRCTATAAGEDAQALLKLLVPSASEFLGNTDSLKLETVTEGDLLKEIRFSGNGTLQDEENTSFQISAVLRIRSGEKETLSVPAPVLKAVSEGKRGTEAILTDVLVRMAAAWKDLQEQDTLCAEMRLRADCGPVAVEDTLQLCRWNGSWKEIWSVRKNGYVLYFTDTAICGEDGKIIAETDPPSVKAADLLSVAYQAFLAGGLEYSSTEEKEIFTVSLDEEGMEKAAEAIAPESVKLDPLLNSGSVQAVVIQGRICEIKVSCSGTVRVAASDADVLLEADMRIREDDIGAVIPDEVKETLEQ
ncbi:MAG: hypothetical protein ACI4WY_10920 [Anaerovoracaceae bacterium]